MDTNGYSNSPWGASSSSGRRSMPSETRSINNVYNVGHWLGDLVFYTDSNFRHKTGKFSKKSGLLLPTACTAALGPTATILAPYLRPPSNYGNNQASRSRRTAKYRPQWRALAFHLLRIIFGNPTNLSGSTTILRSSGRLTATNTPITLLILRAPPRFIL